MALQSPLPVRNGVNATRLRIPDSGPWETICGYVLHRFGHVNPEEIRERFRAREVLAVDGTVVTESTALGAHEFIWYYRSVPEETPIPFTISVLHHDEHLLVVDKPHFVPSTPGGRFLQESALVKMRNRLGNPDLVPLHRLDRATAGILAFSTTPETRGVYQQLFERRQTQKIYEAVSALPEGSSSEALLSRFPLTYRNRMTKTKGVVTARTEDYSPQESGHLPRPRTAKQRRTSAPTTGPNAQTHIELLGAGPSTEASTTSDVTGPDQNTSTRYAHFRLSPYTGKTHQLRVHLAALGLGIVNDPFYPVLQDAAPDDYDLPLQLLARELSFTDPISGYQRRFVSNLTLKMAP